MSLCQVALCDTNFPITYGMQIFSICPVLKTYSWPGYGHWGGVAWQAYDIVIRCTFLRTK